MIGYLTLVRDPETPNASHIVETAIAQELIVSTLPTLAKCIIEHRASRLHSIDYWQSCHSIGCRQVTDVMSLDF